MVQPKLITLGLHTSANRAPGWLMMGVWPADA